MSDEVHDFYRGRQFRPPALPEGWIVYDNPVLEQPVAAPYEPDAQDTLILHSLGVVWETQGEPDMERDRR